MVSAQGKAAQAKENVREAVGYQQDTNKRTYMCCLMITVIVAVILLIVYATSKKAE